MNVVWSFIKGSILGGILGALVMWVVGLTAGPNSRDLIGFLTSFGRIKWEIVFWIALVFAALNAAEEFDNNTEIGRTLRIFRFLRWFRDSD